MSAKAFFKYANREEEPEFEDKFSYPEIVSAYRMWLNELDGNPDKFLSDREFFTQRFLLILRFDSEKGAEDIDVPYSVVESWWKSWAKVVFETINKYYKSVRPPSVAIKTARRHGFFESFLGHFRSITKSKDEFTAPEVQIAFKVWQRSPAAKEGDYNFEPFWKILLEVVGSAYDASMLAQKEVERLGIDPEAEPRRYANKVKSLTRKNRALSNLFSKKAKGAGLPLKTFSLDQIKKVWDAWVEEETSAETMDAKDELRTGTINSFAKAITNALEQSKEPEGGFLLAGFRFNRGQLDREYYRILNGLYGDLIPRLRKQLAEQLSKEKGVGIDVEDYANPTPVELKRLETWGVETKIIELLESDALAEQLKKESIQASMPQLLERFVGNYNNDVARKNRGLPEKKRRPLLEIADYENVSPDEKEAIKATDVPARINAFIQENPDYFTPQQVAARKFAEKLYDRRGTNAAMEYPEILVRSTAHPLSKYDLLEFTSLIPLAFSDPEELASMVEKVNSARHKEGQRLISDDILKINAAEIFEQERNKSESTHEADEKALERILWKISGVPKLEHVATKRMMLNRDIKLLNEQMEETKDPAEKKALEKKIEQIQAQIKELAKNSQTDEEYKYKVDKIINSARRDLAEILEIVWNKARAEYKDALEEQYPAEEKMRPKERAQYDAALQLQLDLEYPPVVRGERHFDLDRQLSKEINNAKRVLKERARGGSAKNCPFCGILLETVPWFIKGKQEVKKEQCPKRDCKFNKLPLGFPEGPSLILGGDLYEPEETTAPDAAAKLVDSYVNVAKKYKEKLLKGAKKALKDHFTAKLVNEYNERAEAAGKEPIKRNKLTPKTKREYTKLKNKAERLGASEVIKYIANKRNLDPAIIRAKLDKFATIDVYEHIMKELSGGSLPTSYEKDKNKADVYLADALPAGDSAAQRSIFQQISEYVPDDTLERLTKSKKIQDFLRSRRHMRQETEALVYRAKPARVKLDSAVSAASRLVTFAPPGFGKNQWWSPPFLRFTSTSYRDAQRDVETTTMNEAKKLLSEGKEFDEKMLAAKIVSASMLKLLEESKQHISQENYEAWHKWYEAMAKNMPSLPKIVEKQKIKPKSLKEHLQDGKVLGGFTGTQRGMTSEQKEKVKQLLQQLNVGVLNHGKCIGADAQADAIAKELGIYTRAFPSTLEGKEAECEGTEVVQEPKPPLERNQDIVDKSYLLIATPEGDKEQMRSGTWATIRRGRKKGMNIYYVMPDGSVYHQQGDKEIEPFAVKAPEPKPEEEIPEGRPEGAPKPEITTQELPEQLREEYAGRRQELIQLIENAEAVVEKDMPQASPEEKAMYVEKLRNKAKQMLRQLPEGFAEKAKPKQAQYKQLLEKRARRANIRQSYLKKQK